MQVPSQFFFTSPHASEWFNQPGTPSATALIPSGPDFPFLCPQAGIWTPEKHPETAVMQLKVDGIGANYIDDMFYSHSGLRLFCAEHCASDMRMIEAYLQKKMVFFAEFENGSFRDTISAMRGKDAVGRVWLYDAVPFDEWRRGTSSEILNDRLSRLEEACTALALQHTGLLSTEIASVDKVLFEIERARLMSLEGFMVKDALSKFCRAKTDDWLKAKVTHTVDAVLIGVQKNKLLVRIPETEETVVVSQSLPKADDMHDVGSVLEIEYCVEAVTNYPRPARFIRWREDKANG